MTEHNGHNGKASPFVTVARDVGQVAHDVVELAELQAALARIEIQAWWKQFIAPIVLVLVASVIAASALLLLLGSAALQLSSMTELSVPLCLFIVACGAVVVALALAAVAYSRISKARGPLEQSKHEFARNLRWIKTALKSSTRATLSRQMGQHSR